MRNSIKATLLSLGMFVAATSYAGPDQLNFKEVRNTEQRSFYNTRETNITLFGGRQVTKGDEAVGGVSAKYFINRNLAFGIEGQIIDTPKRSGSATVTSTLRFPIGESRVAPYVFVGGGAIGRNVDDVRALGQAGAGLEFRFNPNFGVIADYNYNVVDGGNNFGVARAGLNLAF